MANGNLVLPEDDLGVRPASGMDVAVDRYDNAQSPASYNLGTGWVMGAGLDVGWPRRRTALS
ncbi:MAG: hypothetical protein ACLGI2_12775 [Acidimicrobiia bacterium]